VSRPWATLLIGVVIFVGLSLGALWDFKQAGSPSPSRLTPTLGRVSYCCRSIYLRTELIPRSRSFVSHYPCGLTLERPLRFRAGWLGRWNWWPSKLYRTEPAEAVPTATVVEATR
jgi:hypothetical protein